MLKVDESSNTGSKHSDDAKSYYIISNDEITVTPERYHDRKDNQNGGHERSNILDEVSEVHKGRVHSKKKS